MKWTTYDADNEPPLLGALKKMIAHLLAVNEVDEADRYQVKNFALKGVEAYKNGGGSHMNKPVGIDVFRPSEFDHVSSNDGALEELINWLKRRTFEWRDGSKSVQAELNGSFPSAGSRVLAGGREEVILDSYIVIGAKKVAIEIEKSGNWDNGYFSLRQAVRSGAHFGVMIVPWTEDAPGRVNEAKALGRLDREFDGATDLRDGPIYRLAIVRVLDLYRMMLAE